MFICMLLWEIIWIIQQYHVQVNNSTATIFFIYWCTYYTVKGFLKFRGKSEEIQNKTTTPSLSAIIKQYTYEQESASYPLIKY